MYFAVWLINRGRWLVQKPIHPKHLYKLNNMLHLGKTEPHDQVQMANTTYLPCSDNDTDVDYIDCDNSTDTNSTEYCALSRSIPSFVPAYIDYLQAVVSVLIIVASLAINSTYIYLMIRCKQLQQRAFFLALVMVLINLMYTVLMMPVVVAVSIARKWLFGYDGCQASGAIHSFYFITNMLIMAILTLDRAFTVFMPFFYARHGNKIAVCMCLTVFFVTICGSLATLILKCLAFHPAYKICIETSTCSSGACGAFISFYVITVTFFCIALALLPYIAMCLKARKLRQAIDIGNETAKLAFNMRIAKTVAIIISIIIGVMVVGSATYGWAAIGHTYTLEIYVVQSLVGRTISNGMTVTNPIIIMRNKDVRDAWKKIRR